MTTDERNFRSTYYEKVGCRGVEEKKSLEILLKEKPINRMKLKQFCLRFTVPAVHRNILWNILLGVYPTYIDSHEYVMKQREIVFKDLIRALKVLRIIDEKTTKSKVFHAMWLLENQKLYLDFNINTESNFVVITETLLEIFEHDIEAYWISKGFFEFTKEIELEAPKLIDFANGLLQKEDNTLYNHLESFNILKSLPLLNWYTNCFAGIISEPAIVRIWDKICGGSKKILVFVNIVLFTTLRRQILYCKDITKFMECIDNVKDDQETADRIVNKAIELWQQNRGHSEFVVHRKDN